MTDKNKIYQSTVILWGSDSQIGMLIEEMGGLLRAINHGKRHKRNVPCVEKKLAAVEIMLEQMRVIYDGDAVEHFKNEQLKDLVKLLQNSHGVTIESNFENKIIEICAECGRASCIQGTFMCDNSRAAGDSRKTVAELRRGPELENSDYWADKHIEEIYGNPAPFGYKE